MAKKEYVTMAIHETMLEKILEGIEEAGIEIGKPHNHQKFRMMQPLERYLKRKGVRVKYEDR